MGFEWEYDGSCTTGSGPASTIRIAGGAWRRSIRRRLSQPLSLTLARYRYLPPRSPATLTSPRARPLPLPPPSHQACGTLAHESARVTLDGDMDRPLSGTTPDAVPSPQLPATRKQRFEERFGKLLAKPSPEAGGAQPSSPMIVGSPLLAAGPSNSSAPPSPQVAGGAAASSASSGQKGAANGNGSVSYFASVDQVGIAAVRAVLAKGTRTADGRTAITADGGSPAAAGGDARTSSFGRTLPKPPPRTTDPHVFEAPVTLFAATPAGGKPTAEAETQQPQGHREAHAPAAEPLASAMSKAVPPDESTFGAGQMIAAMGGKAPDSAARHPVPSAVERSLTLAPAPLTWPLHP